MLGSYKSGYSGIQPRDAWKAGKADGAIRKAITVIALQVLVSHNCSRLFALNALNIVRQQQLLSISVRLNIVRKKEGKCTC